MLYMNERIYKVYLMNFTKPNTNPPIVFNSTKTFENAAKIPAKSPILYSKMSSSVSTKYVVLKGFNDGAGARHVDLCIVQDRETKEKFVRKRVEKDNGETLMFRQLTGFANINQLHDLEFTGMDGLPASADNYHDYDDLYLEYCDLGSLEDIRNRHQDSKARLPESFL